MQTIIRYIIGKVFHSDTSVTLSVYFNFQGGTISPPGSLGIRDISMTLGPYSQPMFKALKPPLSVLQTVHLVMKANIKTPHP